MNKKIKILFLIVSTLMLFLINTSFSIAGTYNLSLNATCTGRNINFTVPIDTDQILVRMWGAGAGSDGDTGGGEGGGGGFSMSQINVTALENLTLQVGCPGENKLVGAAGGGGGGYSGIFRGVPIQSNALLIASGGGGGSDSLTHHGGAGGGLSGVTGAGTDPATGGNQTIGGTPSSSGGGTAGSDLQGGAGGGGDKTAGGFGGFPGGGKGGGQTANTAGGGGGGGGYFGGGGAGGVAGDSRGGGGGGSGYNGSNLTWSSNLNSSTYAGSGRTPANSTSPYRFGNTGYGATVGVNNSGNGSILIWVFNTSGDPKGSKPNITITAIDLFDRSTINNLSVTIQNGTESRNYTRINGSLEINDVQESRFYNITIRSNQSGGYFNRTYLDINISQNNLQAELYQSIVIFNASEIITNFSINTFTVRSNGTQTFNFSNSSGLATLRLRAGTYNITSNASGYFNSTINFTINPLQESNKTIYHGKIRLFINATKLGGDGSRIGSFEIKLTNSSKGFTFEKSTSGGNLFFDLINGTYLIQFFSDDYANTNTTLSLNETSSLPNYTFFVYTMNSINFTFLDEKIGKGGKFGNDTSIKIELVSDVFSSNYSTLNGSLFLDLVTPSEYRVSYSDTKFRKREYYFKLANRSNNLLDLYLLSTTNGTLITFTIQDETGQALEDASIKLMRYYTDSNSYIIVAMAKTDIEGKAVIDVDFNSAFYKISVTKNDKSTLTDGTKIYATEVTIKINLRTPILDNINIVQNIESSLTFNNLTQTFSYTFTDPTGLDRSGTLIIERIGPRGIENVCEKSATSSSSTILCVINTTNTTGLYKATGYINTLSDNLGSVAINSIDIQTGFIKEVRSRIDKSGLLLSIMLAGTFAGIGFLNPAVSIILFLVGLGAMAIIGFSGMAIPIYISMAIIGGVLIYKLRT